MGYPREQALSEGKGLVESGDMDLQRSRNAYANATGNNIWPYGDDELIIATMLIEYEDPVPDTELGAQLAVWTMGQQDPIR